MYVALADIPPAGLSQHGELPSSLRERLANSLALPGQPLFGRYELRIERPQAAKHQPAADARIQLAGSLSVAGEVPCTACLKPAALQLEIPLALALVPAGREPAALPGGELTAEAVELYTYEGERIALEPVLHDEIIMALPQRALCMPACRGLCPACGQNLNESTEAQGAAHACGAKQASGPFAALAQWRSHPPQAKEK